MPRSIDYYFSVVSPWAFIGHAPFLDVARRHEVEVTFKPVFLGELFNETGGLPLAKRHPARQRYRTLELKRWQLARGIELNVAPKHWPFNPRLADGLVIAAIEANRDPSDLIGRIGSGAWQREEDMADPVMLESILAEFGLPASLLEAAASDQVSALYAANREAAVAADVFGSPGYVLDGEVFWGQDRIDLLDAALSSGRPPFTA